MRRRLAALVAVVLGGAGAGVPLAPAAATNACAGQATLTTSTPISYPVTVSTSPLSVAVRQPPWTAWALSATPGLSACAPNMAKALHATGTLSGWCGLHSATGTTANGHRFAWVNVGAVMVITGGLNGVAVVEPNVAANQSCVSGATSFLVQFGVVTANCLTKFKGLTTNPVPIPPTLTPYFSGLIWVHTDGSNHIWWKLCPP
jgi:hypothetical protein